MCQQNKIARYEMVELLVSTAATRQNFTDIPQLRTQEDQLIIIQDIEFFPLSTYANSQINTAVPGTPNAEIPKAALVLYVQGEEREHIVPLAKLNHIQDGVTPFQHFANSFADLRFVDWTKSYIQFSAAPAGTPYTIPLGVTYLKLNRQTNAPV